MRVVLDTNVLISATFWNGDSNTILGLIEKKEIELIISKEILEEFIGVLGYKDIQEKIRNKNLEMNRTVEKVASISTIVEPSKRFKVIKEDYDDDKFLDCAFEGKAQFIITKDNHLLKLREFEGIRIITPTEFLKEINSFQHIS